MGDEAPAERWGFSFCQLVNVTLIKLPSGVAVQARPLAAGEFPQLVNFAICEVVAPCYHLGWERTFGKKLPKVFPSRARGLYGAKGQIANALANSLLARVGCTKSLRAETFQTPFSPRARGLYLDVINANNVSKRSLRACGLYFAKRHGVV